MEPPPSAQRHSTAFSLILPRPSQPWTSTPSPGAVAVIVASIFYPIPERSASPHTCACLRHTLAVPKMHQQSRYPPRVSSPASNLQTNPTRTNNPRDGPGAGTRSRASSSAAGQDGGQGASGTPDGSPGPGPTRESVKKLDQIIQVRYACVQQRPPSLLLPLPVSFR